ncbi:MAG: 23S rRNA (uracil(1939)-C(5))-methyltransferase RlmD [Verrucomicrobia bacterium]|nr:23S rRNA (uracil(1939)-C(5))-methyltransferase RlmD [Verrucomicrobiota bacterium]
MARKLRCSKQLSPTFNPAPKKILKRLKQPPQTNIDIQRLGIDGEGVGSLEGFTLFVEGALPSENVQVEITEKRKTYGRARLLQVLSSSPHRVKPLCPLFGKCGGCQLMHLSYPQQLLAKQTRVFDALTRIGKLSVEVAPCLPSPQPLAYRNKIQLPVSPRGKLGLYAKDSHNLVEIERCYIHCDLGEKVFQALQPLITTDLRHVLIKTAVHTNQVLVILVTSSSQLLTSLGEQILKLVPEIKGIVQNIQPDPTNTILSKNFHLLAGQNYIEETLCGLTFKVSPASFFQVNPPQAERLYQKALEFAALNGAETVLDAYCGVGTLTLLLAQKAGHVIGVEYASVAIEDAKENARRNNIHNVTFHAMAAEKLDVPPLDVAVLNPPRKGCDKDFLLRLANLKPKRIIYISCDPATLARDLRILCDNGYRVEQVQPFDMFPQTAHVETVVCLSYV